MKKFLLSLLDLIYRKKCYFCSSSQYSVKMCPKCYDSLSFNDIRAERIIEGVNIFCAGSYDKNLQKLIRGLKYHNQRELAHYLAKFMYEYWEKLEDKRDFQVVAVPLHLNRIKKRKYNHMELVAEEFCKMTNLTPNFELIKRVKDTKPQYKLSKKERFNNLNNAFKVDKSKLQSGKILIIDDICTTGSTFEEMIREFKKNGIEDIVCFAATTPFGD